MFIAFPRMIYNFKKNASTKEIILGVPESFHIYLKRFSQRKSRLIENIARRSIEQITMQLVKNARTFSENWKNLEGGKLFTLISSTRTRRSALHHYFTHKTKPQEKHFITSDEKWKLYDNHTRRKQRMAVLCQEVAGKKSKDENSPTTSMLLRLCSFRLPDLLINATHFQR